MVEKHGLLMKTYGWSRQYCRKGITSAEGWVWYAWAKENEATMMGKLWRRCGKGYVAQESDRLMEQAKQNR